MTNTFINPIHQDIELVMIVARSKRCFVAILRFYRNLIIATDKIEL